MGAASRTGVCVAGAGFENPSHTILEKKLRTQNPVIAGCLIAMLFGIVPHAKSESNAKKIPAAPIPIQITQAKTIFISNAGQDNYPDLGDHDTGDNATKYAPYSGGPARFYNQFYAAMQTWGKFKITLSPAQADLIFQIRCEISESRIYLSNETSLSDGYIDLIPKLHLVILDAKTHVILWAFSEYIPPAILQKNRDNNFDTALSSLLEDVKQLTASSSSQMSTSSGSQGR